MPLHTLTGERVYLDANGKATEDESKGVELLGIAGDEIPMERAYDAGLVKAEPKAEEKAGPEMVYYDSEGKRVKEPAPGGTQYLSDDPTRPDANASSESGDDYDAMKKDDLKALAEQRGVELTPDAKVADIRTALRAADQKE